MALNVKDVVDTLKPFYDFIARETPKYVKSLWRFATKDRTTTVYEDIKSAVIGNALSSIFASVIVALFVIIYTMLFFAEKLQYNLGGQYILGAVAMIAVNFILAGVYFTVIQRIAMDGRKVGDNVWRIALSSNLIDVYLAALYPIFVLGVVDLYSFGLMREPNPLEVACELPSLYFPLGLVPIVITRVLGLAYILRLTFGIRNESAPHLASFIFTNSAGIVLLVVTIIHALAQALVMRGMLWYSVLGFDPC